MGTKHLDLDYDRIMLGVGNRLTNNVIQRTIAVSTKYTTTAKTLVAYYASFQARLPLCPTTLLLYSLLRLPGSAIAAAYPSYQAILPPLPHLPEQHLSSTTGLPLSANTNAACGFCTGNIAKVLPSPKHHRY